MPTVHYDTLHFIDVVVVVIVLFDLFLSIFAGISAVTLLDVRLNDKCFFCTLKFHGVVVCYLRQSPFAIF